MKTLYHISQDENSLIKTIEEINVNLGFPNQNGHTLTYSQIDKDIEGNIQPLIISHEAQEIELNIPIVAKEIIDNNEVTADKIKSKSESILSSLVDNAKNYVVDIDAVRTTATDIDIEILKQLGNTIITTSNEIVQKYCVVSDANGIVLSDYIPAAKIETLKTVEQFSDLSAIPSSKFELLPTSGKVIAGRMYDYNGKTVLCGKTHDRTIYPPEQTPDLFSFYRANTDNLDWIKNELVEVGWKRTYNDKQYIVVQKHMTQDTWNPTLTLGTLWNEVQQQGVKPPQWVTGNWAQYIVGYQVFDLGKIWEAKNTTHTWIQPALTGNGAISWKFIKDWV